MVTLTRIYTKGGDKGKTSLGTGQRVYKNSLRMQAIGTVDELNSSLGVIVSFLKENSAKAAQSTNLESTNTGLAAEDLSNLIQSIQNDLFDVGGDLCFPEDDKPDYALQIKESYITRLETWIDRLNGELEPLSSFILPGGSFESAFLHVSRSLARRAERDVCALMQEEEINTQVFQYLNRLSDLLFVMARYQNAKGTSDILWQPGGSDIDKAA